MMPWQHLQAAKCCCMEMIIQVCTLSVVMLTYWWVAQSDHCNDVL